MPTSKQIVEQLGITYRMLDFWCRQGYVKPIGKASPGTGHSRSFSDAEYSVARRMATLTKAGVVAKTAAKCARGYWPALVALEAALSVCRVAAGGGPDVAVTP